MKRSLFVTFLCLALQCLLPLAAQNVFPSAEPAMIYTNTDGERVEESSFDGDAPLDVRFEARPVNLGDYEARYEWQFTKVGEAEPFLTRFEENTEYHFSESGTFQVRLLITFTKGDDVIEWDEMDEPFTLTFAESKLELPNAFTPNGDGINDVFKVKEGYKSIISFKAAVFSRWGKKIYEWTDLEGGWDGTSGGHNVPDGAYYLNVQAQGADGRNYQIKKVIDLLRGFSESSGAATN